MINNNTEANLNDQLRKLTTHREKIREEERSRIALDLHDDLGQKLTVLKMDLTWVATRIDLSSKDISDRMERLQSMIDDSIYSIQRICSQLRPGVLYDLGLRAALEWMLADFTKTTNIETVSNIFPDDVEIDKDLSMSIYRIVQEALTNVARHSGADIVSVTLLSTSDRIKLIIRDNGKGIDKSACSNPGSFGLMGMKERARASGGSLTVRGIKNRGTSVSVTFDQETPILAV